MSLQATPNTTEIGAPVHLPCRGCQETCPHYATCDGKPWRDQGQPKPAPH
ncbi:hypothetical protein [Cellvibrio sp. PSBB023]|nr:hypothetical protein [Cellvibrio sp. PSBB023]